MQKLVFFVGMAGTGKTTVAEKVAMHMPAAFIDRDTVGGRFVEAILTLQGMDPNDRDSDFYRTHLRDLEYDTSRDICIENLAVQQNVFMISPFTAELKSKQWLDDTLTAAGKTREDVDVKVVVVTLQDPSLQRERIEERGTERDTWKLDNWSAFEKRISFLPEINWDLFPEQRIVFDNSGDLTTDKIASLTASILKDPAFPA